MATDGVPQPGDEQRQFIAAAKWVFAKTMAHYNPHEYVVERVEGGPLFDAFVAFVRTGPIRRFRGGRYFCVTVDEYDYWLTHGGGEAGSSTASAPPTQAGTPSHRPPVTSAS